MLTVGEMPDPTPAAGEVRIRIAASRINPGDIKKRQDSFGVGMPYPRVIPHNDGAGQVDQVGEGVSKTWLGRSVWSYGAQSYRPFGTAGRVYRDSGRESRCDHLSLVFPTRYARIENLASEFPTLAPPRYSIVDPSC